MKKVIGLVLGLLPVYAFAECVPVPDCTSIGYTETSCDGDSLKCPFDTTKLRCLPCDSSFRFSCDGENITGGVGNVCNGKYVTCNCVAGAIYSNGECICDNSCDIIGNIYYSDGTCSSCALSDKTAIGIIIYNDNNNHLVVNIPHVKMTWSADQLDGAGNVLLSGNVDIPDLINFTNMENWNGEDNTLKIVDYYGEDAVNVAGVYCYNYEVEGTNKGQWYLPSLGELYNSMYINRNLVDEALGKLNKDRLWTKEFWSSSEYNDSKVYRVGFGNGATGPALDKSGTNKYVKCFLKIS